MNTHEKVDAIINALGTKEQEHHENAQSLEQRKQTQDAGDIMYHSLENAEYFFKGKTEATQEAADQVLQTFDAHKHNDNAYLVSRLLHRLALEEQHQEVLINTPTGLMTLARVGTYTDANGKTYTTLEVE